MQNMLKSKVSTKSADDLAPDGLKANWWSALYIIYVQTGALGLKLKSPVIIVLYSMT